MALALRSALSVTGYAQPPKVGDAGRSPCTEGTRLLFMRESTADQQNKYHRHGFDDYLGNVGLDSFMLLRKWVSISFCASLVAG